MDKHDSPFVHSPEARPVEKASQIHGNSLHSCQDDETRADMLRVQCSCGCCGREHTPPSAHGHDCVSEDGISWKKLAVAGIFAVSSEIFHFAQEGGILPASYLFEFLPLLCALVAIALSGLDTYRAGWNSIRKLDLNMTALMSVAVTGAVLIGQFPEAAMVMVLFNISEAIEERVVEKARHAIRELLTLAPESATVLQPDGTWREKDCRQIPLGAQVRVKPGERIGLDGVVTQGYSAVDQSPITGESIPVEKGPGDPVFAGTINISGSFDFEVTAASTDTQLARIVHAVEKAQASRAPIQRFVDSFARWYTPCIFAVSLLLVFLPPLLLGAGWSSSIYIALVVLVIGCPCALVISTPVTIMSGMAAATRLGMLVKGGSFLEQGRLLRVLALDKTGTLTHGCPCLSDIVSLCTPDKSETFCLGMAASLAVRSDHPVSRAITEASDVELCEVQDFVAVPGKGVQGKIQGCSMYLGSLRMMEGLGLLGGEVGDELRRKIIGFEEDGKSVAILADKGQVLALFAVADRVRESSVQAVCELRDLGVKTIMLTGDNKAAARYVADQTGVDEFRAGLLPEEKLIVVEALVDGERGRDPEDRKGIESGRPKVGMVGDGINDAPALACADIGFAMAGSGTDTAMETADVALMDDDLRKIPRFIRLSRRVYGILMMNIVLALGMKGLFFGLTLVGHTSMWMAVFADVGTALLVVGNGLRAGR